MHTLDGIDFKNLGNDVTVKTSVSYKVSSSKGKILSYREPQFINRLASYTLNNDSFQVERNVQRTKQPT